MQLFLILHIFSISLPSLLSQPDFFDGDSLEFGGPPPFGRRGWGRRGGFGHRHGPWGRHGHRHRHHHRHRHGPWRHPPPGPLDYEDALPLPPPPVMMPPPRPIPVPVPPVRLPVPAPAPAYSPNIQRLISDVDRSSTAFHGRGRSYSDVISIMKQYYSRKSGIQYDVNSVAIPTSAQFEMAANRKAIGAFYETDLILTVDQIRHITGTNRQKRKVATDSSKRWPTVNIPYRFAINDATWKSSIKSALSLFVTNTCFRFTENGAGNDYILFNRGEGCYSGVGRLGGAQEISIGYGCETAGIISHEVSHTIGLWHEQSRPDRDSYVRVLLNNVIRGSEAQFDKRSTSDANTYGIAYDYGSVMHYGSNSFARSSSLNTIEPFDSVYQHTIGSRIEPSFLDFKAINKAFCSRSCAALSCQHGGYANPNACNRCICPSGFGGTYCERLQYSACGRELSSASAWQTLSYSGSSNCYWRIRAPPGTRVRFDLTTVYFKCAPICEEFVEVKFDSSFERSGYRLCCKPEFGQKVSAGNDIIVISRASAQSQFVLKYKTEGVVAPPRPAPTRRPPATPPRTPAPYHRTGVWSGWSGWSACTEKCGACGKRTRARSCSGGSCSGGSGQTQTCNQNACVRGTTLGRGKRSVIEREKIRVKRADYWCCSGFQLVNGKWCNPSH